MSVPAPHADLMDRTYRLQRHIYDATRRYYLIGRDRLIARLDPPPGGTVIEIGVGTGRNLARAARLYPQASFYGIDISAVMLETARATFLRHGLTGRALLARADATRFDADILFDVPLFDRVFFSYSLSMIPDWRMALRTALAHLKPGGTLHIVDFGAMGGMPRPARAGLRLWLKIHHVTPRIELRDEIAAIAAQTGMSVAFEELGRGYAFQACLTKPAATTH